MITKYETMRCTGFWLPVNPRTRAAVDLVQVLVAKGDWDGEEDADDERIFYYMDGDELSEGDIIAEDFVITKIEEDEE